MSTTLQSTMGFAEQRFAERLVRVDPP